MQPPSTKLSWTIRFPAQSKLFINSHAIVEPNQNLSHYKSTERNKNISKTTQHNNSITRNITNNPPRLSIEPCIYKTPNSQH